MAFGKAQKLAQKSVALQRQLLHGLASLVKSIERGEKMITELKEGIEAVNLKHRDRKTTREDIAYLEDLLRCAKKKLAWEEKMESLRQRIPALLANVSTIMNDAKNPPAEEIRAAVIQSLSTMQGAMERLEKAKLH
jgi:hypothetical protein